MDLINIKYVGTYPVLAQITGFGKGLLMPNDIIKTTKENWEKELKENENWVLVEETKTKKNKSEEDK